MFNFESLYKLETDLYDYLQTTDEFLRCIGLNMKMMTFELYLNTIENNIIFKEFLDAGILGCNFIVFENHFNKWVCKLNSLYIDKEFIHGYYSSVIRINLVNVGFSKLKLCIIDDSLYLKTVNNLQNQGKRAFADLLDYKSLE